MVIAICCLDTGGGGGFGSGGSMMIAKDTEGVELSGPWRVRKGLSKSAVPEIPYTRGVDHWTPSALYGGMIEPVRPYGVRGMLWYQEEANVASPDEYRLLFPAMIVDWRERWGQEALYLVQLAPTTASAARRIGRWRGCGTRRPLRWRCPWSAWP